MEENMYLESLKHRNYEMYKYFNKGIEIISELKSKMYEAYIVGGAVRDFAAGGGGNMEMRYFFWSSSFLILGICVIRRLCSRGTSMKHRYTLWLMAVVTLCLLPFSSKMPPSMFSILNVANVLEGWMAGDGRDLEDLETGDQEHGKQTEAWGGK